MDVCFWGQGCGGSFQDEAYADLNSPSMRKKLSQTLIFGERATPFGTINLKPISHFYITPQNSQVQIEVIVSLPPCTQGNGQVCNKRHSGEQKALIQPHSSRSLGLTLSLQCRFKRAKVLYGPLLVITFAKVRALVLLFLYNHTAKHRLWVTRAFLP